MKKLAGLLALIMSLSCFTACDLNAVISGLMGGGNTTSATDSASKEEVSMEVLGEQEMATLKKGESKTYAVNKDIPL